MNALTLFKLRRELSKIAQMPSVVVLPMRSRMLPAKAEEVQHELSKTPQDIWSAPSGPGSALRSVGIGGAVGGGLGHLAGVTAGGRVPLIGKPLDVLRAEKELALQQLKQTPGASTSAIEAAERAVKELGLKSAKTRAMTSKAVRSLGLIGAGAGLGTNLYYQAKRHGLKKKLEESLGPKLKKLNGKKKVGEDLLLMAARAEAEKLLGR